MHGVSYNVTAVKYHCWTTRPLVRNLLGHVPCMLLLSSSRSCAYVIRLSRQGKQKYFKIHLKCLSSYVNILGLSLLQNFECYISAHMGSSWSWSCCDMLNLISTYTSYHLHVSNSSFVSKIIYYLHFRCALLHINLRWDLSLMILQAGVWCLHEMPTLVAAQTFVRNLRTHTLCISAFLSCLCLSALAMARAPWCWESSRAPPCEKINYAYTKLGAHGLHNSICVSNSW